MNDMTEAMHFHGWWAVRWLHLT